MALVLTLYLLSSVSLESHFSAYESLNLKATAIVLSATCSSQDDSVSGAEQNHKAA